MSNKKRIAKKVKGNSFTSLKKEYLWNLYKLRLENGILRAQLLMVSSQPKKEYPSGGNIGIVKSDGSKEKITDRRGNIKNVGVIHSPENNSYFELNNGIKIKCSEMAENLYRMTEPKKLEGMSALEIDKMGNVRNVFAGSRVHQQKK